MTVIGVTGTDGKTTTTTLIYELLKATGKKASMISTVGAVIAGKTYDTGFHVTNLDPWDLQKYFKTAVDAGDTYMVLEVTSHGIDQYRVWGITFFIGVITNITHEHLDWHKTFDEYVATKFTFVKRSTHPVINKDDEASVQYLKKYPIPNVKFFGLNKERVKTTLPGDYNQYNIQAALTVGEIIGLDKQAMKKTIETFKGIIGRMEIIAEKPFTVIVDFAHTPNALHQVLSTVKKTAKGRLIHVFGCAGLRDHTKRPLMGKESDAYTDVIVLTEEDTRTEHVEKIMDEISSGFKRKKSVYRYPNRREAIEFALKHATLHDTVIVTGKGHEKSLCRGTTEYPWSDQETIRNILKEMNYA